MDLTGRGPRATGGLQQLVGRLHLPERARVGRGEGFSIGYTATVRMVPEDKRSWRNSHGAYDHGGQAPPSILVAPRSRAPWCTVRIWTSWSRIR